MDVRDYLRVVRASWALLLLGVLLGGGVAAGMSMLLPAKYTATTQLFVSTSGASDIAQAVQGSQYTERKVESYAQLLTSKELATAVIRDLSLDVRPRDLMEQVEAKVVKDTTILDVSVTDRSPERAEGIATSIASEFQSLVRRLESAPGDENSPVRVSVVATPELPESPSSPALIPNTALGLVLGLVLAGLLAVVRDRLDTTVKDDTVASDMARAPVIGHVPEDDELARAHVLAPHSTSGAAEAVRQVRANLGFLDVDDPPRVIMVTSSLAGEGKTTLAINLAMTLAESGSSVALVEVDLRRPKVTRYLGLVGGAGLTDVLRGDAPLEEVTQELFDGRLWVLPSGRTPPNPSELLSSHAMASVVKQLLDQRDIVVIDAPPVLPVADASAMAGLVDGVLLCARWGTVTTEQLQRSAATFERLGAKVLGLVLTVVPVRRAAAVYGYGYESEHVESRSRSSRLSALFRRSPRSDVSATIVAVQPRTRENAPASTRPASENPGPAEARSVAQNAGSSAVNGREQTRGDRPVKR